MRLRTQLAGICAALFVTAGACGATNAAPLRIFYFNWAGYGPLFLAQDKGFFAEQCGGGRVAECRVIEVLADHSKCLASSHPEPPAGAA